MPRLLALGCLAAVASAAVWTALAPHDAALSLLVLAGALVTVFIVKHHESNSTEQTAYDEKGKKLFDVKSDDITRLVIRPAGSSGTALQLDKKSGKWQLVKPINWPADDFEARGLVDSNIDLRSQGGVELSSQKADLKDALFNALKEKDRAETDNPLVVEGQMLIPSVTRVFSKSKDMYVFLQAYQPKADTPNPIVGYVTLYKGSTKAPETCFLFISDPADDALWV